MVAEGYQVFFIACLTYCTVEFPSAHADTEVIEAYVVSGVHVVETDVWSVFFEQCEGLEFVLKDKFAEAHFVFFAHATDVVHVFWNDEGHVDVCRVEYLHYFLNFAMVTENIHWSLFKSAFH